MALPGGGTPSTQDLEHLKFIESTSTAGKPGVIVLNPDGSNVGNAATQGTGATYVQGGTASGGSNISNPVKVGFVYNATQPTVTTGQVVDGQADANGNQRVVEQYAPAYEDNVNGIAKVNQVFSATNITGTTTTTPKSAAGLLHGIIINQAVATGTIVVYDNTAASGTKLATIIQPGTVLQTVQPITYNALFTTGLTIVTSGTAQDITAVWR